MTTFATHVDHLSAPGPTASPRASISAPSPSTGAASTTAPANRSPAPVVVVDDPLNPWDVMGVVIGLLVGAVSVFLAWRAVEIGRRANDLAAVAAAEAEVANHEAANARLAVARERRRAFELEVLRDLLDLFDMRVRRSSSVLRGPGALMRPVPDFESDLTVSELVSRARARLLLLDDGDLPSWRGLETVPDDDPRAWTTAVQSLASYDGDPAVANNASHAAPSAARDDLYVFEVVKDILAREVVAAIRTRVEAQDS